MGSSVTVARDTLDVKVGVRIPASQSYYSGVV